MKYISFFPRKHNIGGLGHCFIDYLSSLIISYIREDFTFVHNNLILSKQKRDMNVKNNHPIYFWNNFLNLNNLSKLNIYHKDIKKLEKKEIKNSGSFEIKKSGSFVIKNSGSWLMININDIKKKKFIDNKLYYLVKNNRITIFDLYYYELNNIVKKGITRSIIIKLNTLFYQKHKKLIKKKKIINVYLRRGDLNERKNNKRNNRDDSFVLNTLELIVNIPNSKNLENYEINIISAGTKEQMHKIKEDYKGIKANFLLNKEMSQVFYLMTQSDILLFHSSSFPITASYYCNGLIIIKKTNKYLFEMCINKNIKFLNNYIITDIINEDNMEKIKYYIL